MIADAANPAIGQADIAPLAVSGFGAARLLGVSPRTFRRLDAAGQVPRAIRVGSSKRWSVRELTDWVASGAPSSRERWESMKVAAEADNPRRRRTTDARSTNGSTKLQTATKRI